MINGIGDIADRSDLLDRAVRLTLPTIPDDQRRTERAIWSAFELLRPAILGAFLDAVSVALRNRDSVRFARLPRMADCAVWVVAAEPACPWAPGQFIAALEEERRDADEFAIEANLIASSIRDRVDRCCEIHGTATDILELLSADMDDKVLKRPDWPKGAPAFGTRLREIAPNLRCLGIEVQWDRSGRRRTITIRRAGKPPESLSLPSSSSPVSPDAAGEAGNEGDDDSPCESDLPFSDGDPQLLDVSAATNALPALTLPSEPAPTTMSPAGMDALSRRAVS